MIKESGSKPGENFCDFHADSEDLPINAGKIPAERKIDRGFNNEKKEISFLINSFENEKSAEKRLNILEDILNSGIVDNQLLDFIEKFSNNLADEENKIWSEDKEYGEYIDAASDDDMSVIKPFVLHLIDILKNTRETEFQAKGEKALMNLLEK